MDVIYAKQNEYNPTLLFLQGVVCYVLILCAAALSQSDALKAVANAVAVSLFLVSVAAAVFLREESRGLAGFTSALIVYYAAIVASAVVTPTYLQVADVLKFGMAPAFFLIGGAFEANRAGWPWARMETRLSFWSLAALPLVVLMLQFALDMGGLSSSASFSHSDDGIVFGIFSNRNNAALYAVSLLALYTVLSGRPVKNVLFILGLCALFGTLGVLVAAIAALTVAVGRRGAFKALALAFIVLVVLYVLLPEAPGIRRLTPVLKSIVLLYEGTIDLRTVTFAQLVEMLNTTDLSFLFRLKHWINLLDLYAAGSLYQWLFGLGIGSSVEHSATGLVPHNDYLRLLFECGLLGFAGFVGMIAAIVHGCGRRWESVPLLIIVFYFISENLVNNYLAMSIFFFCAGSLATRATGSRND